MAEATTRDTPLTDRQQEMLGLLYASARDQGRQLTFRELGKEMGIKSPNAVMGHIRVLIKRGYIAKPDGNRNGWIILRRPDGEDFTGFLDRAE